MDTKGGNTHDGNAGAGRDGGTERRSPPPRSPMVGIAGIGDAAETGSDPAAAAPTAAAATPRRDALLRWLPLLLLVAAMVVMFATGWHKLLSLRTIGLNYEQLQGLIARNLPIAIAVYVLAYVLVVSLSLPGGFVLTVSGGLLFGWKLGAPLAIIGATIGATIVFLIARTSFGEVLARRAGPRVLAMAEGFRDNAMSYLLFLRLVPVFPFFLVNLVPGLVGVPLSTYVVATALGIIPATAAFSIAGSGLGSVVTAQTAAYKACLAAHATAAESMCTYKIDTRDLVTTETLLAFAALGLVALIPVALKRWSKRNAAA